MSYIIIGSVPVLGKSETLGGTTILLREFCAFLELQNIDYKLIQTNRSSNAYWNMILSCFNLFRSSKRFRVVIVNGADTSTFYLAPVLWCIAKLTGRKFVFRKFGGSFDKMLDTASVFKVSLVKATIFKSDLFYLETKSLLRSMNSYKIEQMKWFPNVRRASQLYIKREYQKRFVFIGQVKVEKGIKEIIQASCRVDSSYTFDIYGPFTDGSIVAADFEGVRANYKGVLEPSAVLPKLNEYDVVVLPSFHPGEGYPGIIVEAFSLGKPCIVTTQGGLGELVNDGYNGLIVEPKDVDDLVEKIESVTSEMYVDLSANAKSSFDDYDSELVHKRVLGEINQLLP